MTCLTRDEFLKRLFLMYPQNFTKNNASIWREAYEIVLDDEKLDYDRMFRLMVSGYKSIALPPPPSWFEPYKDQCKQQQRNKALEKIAELKKQGGCPPPQKFKEAADKLRRKVEAMQYIHE